MYTGVKWHSDVLLLIGVDRVLVAGSSDWMPSIGFWWLTLLGYSLMMVTC